eukprot:Protomagalhaensia_sp_Gyna_25__1132@NODE_1555_length_1736_cov_12_884502_g1262_i0_p3_GENE_NODE_1555_length_1736_cov_12_884502_g1262_i0NODE_1555_length_1736_cov_12_884502_g1262_i0_p3_ORF_typecomplete_len111_score20_51IZUMO/PF15005_6/0_027PRP1_N/PF06424_12/0_15V_ATPase_I/PF01496_19/0_14_NODE_1555_length_1736_cov_12_884502_g1262_i013261658
MQELTLSQRARKQRRTATIGTGPSVSPPPASAEPTEITDDRKDLLKGVFDDLQSKYEEQEWESDKLLTAVNKRLLKMQKRVFEEAEFKAAVRKLQVENQLMVVQTRVYFI